MSFVDYEFAFTLSEMRFMVVIRPEKIVGNWSAGIALDVHTVRSRVVGTNFAGEPQFENTRSDLGELLYRLKYESDVSAAAEIISTAAAYLRPYRPEFDMIVPVPASSSRPVQVVLMLANGIGGELNLPVANCVRTSRQTTPLKDIVDPKLRHDALFGLYDVDPTVTMGKNVLLLDDLYRSGATMTSITSLLRHQGKAASVKVLAITRTRRNR